MKKARIRLFRGKNSPPEESPVEPSESIDVEERPAKLNRAQSSLKNFVHKLRTSYRYPCLCLLAIIAFILFNAYLITAITYKDNWNKPWCDGIRIVVYVTFILYGYLFYYKVFKVLCATYIRTRCKVWGLDDALKMTFRYPVIHMTCFAAFAIYVLLEAMNTAQTLISYAGIWILLIFAFVCSKHHTRIHWRQVYWGLNLQFAFILFCMNHSLLIDIYYCTKGIFVWIGDQVNEGASFVFGFLITGEIKGNENIIIPKQPAVRAFQMISDLLVFSMLFGIFHQCKLSKTLILYYGRVFKFCFDIGNVEAVVAFMSLYFGMAESIFFVKYFMPYVSRADIYAISVVGMATHTSAFYGSFRLTSEVTSQVAFHQVVSDIISIPSALTMTRLIYPDIDGTKLTEEEVNYISANVAVYRNIGESIFRQIYDAIRLSGAIIATGMVFVVLPHLLDAFTKWFGSMAGFEDLSFMWLLAQVLRPMVYIVGIEWKECFPVAEAVALKLMYEEIKADKLLERVQLSNRAKTLSVYLLNDTANIIHLAFNMATISILVPSRLSSFVDTLGRAFFTAIATSWLNACIAGALFS